MRIKEFSKKFVAYACAATLAVGSLAGYSASTVKAADVQDILLDGDEGTHESAMIGTFKGTSSEYIYEGWASFKDAREHESADNTVNDYKYLIMTYTGDIEFLRFEFTRIIDQSTDQIEKFNVWFNPNQENHFVTYDGSEIPYDTISEEKTTLVLDLSKVMADGFEVLSWYNDGVHMHNGAGSKLADGFREVGSFEITSARLSASPEIIAEDSEDHDFVVTPSEPKPTTPQPTKPQVTKPKPTTPQTTKAKVTKPKKAKVTKVATKKKSAKKVKLTLKKITGAKGYQVAVYSSKKNAKKNKKAVYKKFVTKYKNVTLTSKKLKNKKTLYVKARAYKLNGKAKVYGAWSTAKKVKIKK